MALDVVTLEDNFKLVKPNAHAFASDFYANLFADYPQVRPLFAETNMNEQYRKLVLALALVVENLRKPDTLNPTLQGLGARHVKYGILPEHYPMVGAALLKTLATHLGAAWTPQAEQAWTNAYGAISTLMLDGAEPVPAQPRPRDVESATGSAPRRRWWAFWSWWPLRGRPSQG